MKEDTLAVQSCANFPSATLWQIDDENLSPEPAIILTWYEGSGIVGIQQEDKEEIQLNVGTLKRLLAAQTKLMSTK